MHLDQITEKFGLYFSEVGLNRTYGRLFGTFMSSSTPLSMRDLIEQLQISKSTASTEIRRLLSMGVIEKVFLPQQRAEFFQLQKNIWGMHLSRKANDIKKLREIVEAVPYQDRTTDGLKELNDYCIFMEEELQHLIKKYASFSETKGQKGSWVETGKNGKKYVLEWAQLSALSDAFADKMASLAELGIGSFFDIEREFLSAYPQAMEEDPSITEWKGLEGEALDEAIRTRLGHLFHFRPEQMSQEMRVFMADANYTFVTVREEGTETILGFATYLTGGPVPKGEAKITVLAVDEAVRGNGLGGFLARSYRKMGSSWKKLRVSTRPSNLSAIRAYRSWGFVEDLEAETKSSPHFVKGHWIHLTNSNLLPLSSEFS